MMHLQARLSKQSILKFYFSRYSSEIQSTLRCNGFKIPSTLADNHHMFTFYLSRGFNRTWRVREGGRSNGCQPVCRRLKFWGRSFGSGDSWPPEACSASASSTSTPTSDLWPKQVWRNSGQAEATSLLQPVVCDGCWTMSWRRRTIMIVLPWQAKID